MVRPIVGREAELAFARAFVASVRLGAGALVLEGEAGIGKTTVWEAAAAAAEEGGALVLRARPAQAETALSFSGLRDLLDPVLDEVLEPLPELQRRALAQALVLEADGGPAPDPHALGVSVLGALRALASAREAVVLAVDDVQWLDVESAATLAYAGRRLSGERAGFLFTKRSGAVAHLVEELRRSHAPDRLREIDVLPLALPALHDVIVRHLQLALAAPLLADVHTASGGNPFYALELVRTLQRRGGLLQAGRPLPVPESLHGLVHGRLQDLPAEARSHLLVAAADPQATLDEAEEVTGLPRSSLAPALEGGVVELDGDRIRFTHPLLAAGAYELADPLRRTEVHARLAELAEDPERRGRHLAVSVTRPSRAVALALDEAARRALSRGAPRAAGLLLERARDLTPSEDADGATRRALEAASVHHEAGDSERAKRILEAELERLEAGPERAQALIELARVRSYDDDLRGASALFEEAAAVAEPGSVAQARAREGLGATLFRLRERLADAVESSARAAEAARVHDVPVLLAEALATKAIAEAVLGHEEATATAREALALEDACGDRPVLRRPRFAVAVVRFWHDDLLGARCEYEELAALAGKRGDESSLPYVRVMLAQIDCALGRFDSAVREAEAGCSIAEGAGQRTLLAYLLAVTAVAQAHLGRVEAATASGTRALELASATSGIPAWIFASWALGHLALARGDPEAALERLEPLRRHHAREGIEEPGALPFLPDGIEALILAGRVEEAGEALARYHATAERLGRRRGLAAALRLRGVLAQSLDDAGAAARLAAANETPFEHARALLALGAAQRRAKRRREARETLEESLGAFERLGAAVWADRARSELRRISGRAPAAGALTPAEERVAALVCEGKTNREVAAALYLSDRTVEGHLSRIFGKLGIAHRNQLGAALAASQTQGTAASNTGDSPVSAEPVAP